MHAGHLSLARAALREGNMDWVYLVPSLRPPHREKAFNSFRVRCRMIRRATERSSRIRLSPLEASLKGIGYAYKTLRGFRRRFPKAEIFLIMGSDRLKDILRWKNAREILYGISGIIVGKRPGSSTGLPAIRAAGSLPRTILKIETAPFHKRVRFLKARFPKISSTQLRRACLP